MTPIVDRGELASDICMHTRTVVRTDSVGPFESCLDCSRAVDGYGQFDAVDELDEVTWIVVVWISMILFTATVGVGLIVWLRLS
ncbi:hypothetical protein [Rhodococcus xishaensis]|uniref:Uncharacterized protein n=1 Tax=Rhodococcus xishaensis TaxID=2487364 RepID=A0A438AWD4_9NOCA|nr:hypothetical protein [Rhodococcus xishaensis]RVW03031.1 hypothetical protein EGT50_10000 [Rhodococcus xishaensis]